MFLKLKTIKSVSIPPEAFVLTLDYLTKATNVSIGGPMKSFVIDSEVMPPLSESSKAKIAANSDWLLQLDKKLVAKPANLSNGGSVDQSDNESIGSMDFDPFGVLDRKLKKWTTKMFQSYRKAMSHHDVAMTSSLIDPPITSTTATTVTTDWSLVTTTATTVTPAATTSTSWIDQWDDSLFKKDESFGMSHRLPEYDEMLENFDEGLWENLDLDLSSGDGSKGEQVFKELLDDVTSKNYVIDDDDVIIPDIIEPINSRYVPNQSYDELYDDSLWNETDGNYDHSGSGDDHYHDRDHYDDGSVPTMIAPILSTEIDKRGDDVITDESSDVESSTWTDGTTMTAGFDTATSVPTTTTFVTTTLANRVTMDPNVLVTVTETSLVTDVTVYSDSDYECDDSDLCDEFESGSGDKESPTEV